MARRRKEKKAFETEKKYPKRTKGENYSKACNGICC
jgi:hypothetical protein